MAFGLTLQIGLTETQVSTFFLFYLTIHENVLTVCCTFEDYASPSSQIVKIKLIRSTVLQTF